MAKKSVNSTVVVAATESIFNKLPALPKNWTKGLALIAPWLALIFGVLGVLGSLAALGLSPLAGLGGVKEFSYTVMISVVGLAESVLLLIATPGLFGKRMGGWNLLFWSEFLGLIVAVLGVSFGGIIGSAIALYLVFQIKSYYK